MTKSLLMGMTACVTLALVGPTFAFAKHPADKHPIRSAENGRRDPNNGTQLTQQSVTSKRPYPTQFRIPAHPLVRDCVHVVFPQCSRGYGGLNDGSFW